MSSNKGQTGIVTYFFGVIVFLLVWAFWLGSFFSEWGARAIADNSLTGFEAFLWSNINFVIFFCLAIASSAVVAIQSQ